MIFINDSAVVKVHFAEKGVHVDFFVYLCR